VSEQHLNFLIVCNHGIRGGQLDPVMRLPWWPDRGDWWSTQDDDVSRLTALEGNRQGWNPHRLISGYQDKPDDEPMRMHQEIPCPKEGCTRRAYRSDGAKLQTLFKVIATDQKFRDVFPVSVDDTMIVITLEALHLARDTAKTRYGLLV
jgi:hypothetical protein